MAEKKRTIAVIYGSDSDLPQMLRGLKYLLKLDLAGEIKFLNVDSASQHRHTKRVEAILEEYDEMPEEICPDVIITGAGWANHLSGCSDAYLRYTLKNNKIVVFGVAFEDKAVPLHTKAAELSITEVPGTNVVFKGVGEKGFLKACIDAVNCELPRIVLKEPPESKRRTLEEAIEKGERIVLERSR